MRRPLEPPPVAALAVHPARFSVTVYLRCTLRGGPRSCEQQFLQHPENDRPSGTFPRAYGHPNTPTRRATRGRRLSCPSPRTPRENCAYVPARTQTRAAPFQSCAHVRLPCAGAPWPSRAARTSCAPLALPEQAAYPLTPRRARRSTPHQHTCAFLRPVQALQTASGIS